MNKGQRETLTIRVVSTAFATLALAVFKPFGLDALHWQAYVHLGNVFLLGVVICMVTDVILKYVVKMPRSYEHGASYIIRRNLWFQLINTPLVAFGICLYRHFVLSDRVENNHLSWGNFFETLLIIAFCSFAIGLYWRFKYRSKYLAMELEETRQLNEQLMKSQAAETTEQPILDVVLTGTTNESVALQISQLLYIEAVGNYVKVTQLHDGEVKTNMLRATMKQMEDSLQAYPMIVRCHRAFMVNLAQVEQISSNSRAMQLVMRHSHDSIPVSRSNVNKLKELLKQR